VPGAKFSMKTSEVAMSFDKSFLPDSDFRLQVMLFLLVFSVTK